MPWQPPSLTLSWPPYFRPSAEDQAAIGNTVREDHDAGLITRKTAVEKRAEFYGIKDVQAYLKELEDEAAEKMAHAHDMMAALGKGPGEDDDDGEGQDDPPAVGKAAPPKPPGAAPRGGKAPAGPEGDGGRGDKRGKGRRPGKNRRSGGPAGSRG